MRNTKAVVVVALVVFALTGCQIFEDQTPEFINVRMGGTAGEMVTVVYSKQFIAGVDETGVTRVEVFGSDTVVHTLPVDTIIDVRLERQLFLQAAPQTSDSVSVDVRIEVDGRNLFERTGSLFLSAPWLFLYQYNARATDQIEVII